MKRGGVVKVAFQFTTTPRALSVKGVVVGGVSLGTPHHHASPHHPLQGQDNS
ncbi:MAG: hypothetical protein WCG15_01665 [Actinomycetes bacterium]|jgi:hypothetical protein